MMETQFKISLLFFLVFLNSVVTQQSSPVISNSEWQALLHLRSSLRITAKDWHKKVRPCLNWTGIECKNGHVTGINLSGLRRTHEGKLNPQFAVDSLPNFAFLSSFNSSGFLLPGSIPEWFGLKLNNLEVLDLRSSSIYGSIPSSIGSLRKLRSLYLSNNSITSIIPVALGKLVSLSVLDLSQNLLTGRIPDEVLELKNLISLDLSSNFLSGGIPLGLGSLSSLKSLNLSNNSLRASIPAQLGNLSQLISLDLGYNSLLGPLPKELGGLRNLRKMLIGNNGLQGSLLDDLFQKITHLEYLSLCRNYLDGRLPDAIWSMPHLRYVDVSANNFSGVFPSLVASFNVNGGVFNFSNNLFYGNFISRIGKLSIIDLSSNYFQGSAPNDEGSSIILINNCFSSVPGQRNSGACKNFYSEKGLSFGNDSVGEPVQPPMMETPKRNNRTMYIKVGLFGGLGFVMVLIAGLLLLLKRFKFGSTNHQRSANVRPVLEGGRDKSPMVSIDCSGIGESFAYEQILQATCNFSNENLIKHGHSGDLFQGTLESGHPVVIKRVDLHSFGKESFMSELNLFGKVTHPRLVPLVGHCLEDENVKILVYKYMPNGDLSNSLYKLNDMEDVQSLDWITRLKIATGAAEALCYLHHECIPPLVHREIQASSILLDDKYEVRLGSMSEVCAQGTDTPQNMIARMILTTQNSGKRPSGSSSVTCAYDVFCFGKVLLELITGRIGISNLNEADAKQWLESTLPLISIHEKELVIKIVDQSLIIDEDLLEEVWAVAIMAKSCLNPKASRRPSMRHVLKALENPFKVVREENFSSARLRTVSSTWSWTAAFFGSWHHSSSGSSNISGQREIIGGLRQSERIGSRGSGVNEHSSSLKRSSSDVFPEPIEMQVVERQDESS